MFEWIKVWFLEATRQTVELPLHAAAPLMVLIGALDSSLLSLPEVNDYITVARIAHLPHEVLYFPLFPAIGSVIGSFVLYRIARGGEQLLERKFKSHHLDRVKSLYQRWGLFALVIPALLPPPMPFKIFVAMAGALGYPPGRFVVVILSARAIRYYFWGVLAFFLRDEVKLVFAWLEDNFFTFIGSVIIGAAVAYIIYRLFQNVRNRSLRSRTQATYSD